MSTENEHHAPLLRPRQDPPTPPTSRQTTLSVLLGRATGRRVPSMLVRETAARELDERRADWGYSKPVVALDMIWNAAFVVVSVTMLVATVKERPGIPIRIWICGYALQCLVHVVLVWLEYRRRNTRRERDIESQQQSSTEEDNVAESDDEDDRAFFTSPRSRMLHVCTGQEGASEADLIMLPKYKFQMMRNEEKPGVGVGKMVPVERSSGSLGSERVLLPEDAECCICLSPYEHGAELHALPCNHHFHATCIVKWLKMNATCPLCKFNILKENEQI